MLKLRPFKPSDASVIAGWIHTETELRKWSSDRYGSYPITGDDIIDKYLNHNGDCVEPDNFYPMTAFDESGAVGHFILRYTDAEKSVLRLGFVIVDDTKRGKGYGKEMLSLAVKYAFEIFKAEKLTIGVFANNPSALYCYRAAGFTEIGSENFLIMGESWECIEMELKKRRD